jgi:hypothetical protein
VGEILMSNLMGLDNLTYDTNLKELSALAVLSGRTMTLKV